MIKLQHFNVMVVEDEDLLLKSTARHVEELDMGFRVKAMCHNGAEALALLESQNIHLIITDIQMPVMSGLILPRSGIRKSVPLSSPDMRNLNMPRRLCTIRFSNIF